MGFAISTKYNALLNLISVPIAFAYYRRRGPGFFQFSDAWRPIIVFWSAAIAAAAPWFLKNLVFYRNPVAPFLP